MSNRPYSFQTEDWSGVTFRRGAEDWADGKVVDWLLDRVDGLFDVWVE